MHWGLLEVQIDDDQPNPVSPFYILGGRMPPDVIKWSSDKEMLVLAVCIVFIYITELC